MSYYIDTAWIHCAIVGFKENNEFLITRNYFIGVTNGIISAIAPMEEFAKYTCTSVYDVKGKIVTSGLIDCHTHLVYGHSRTDEFERRLNGESYGAIAAGGGGILSTIKNIRELSAESLFELSLKRLQDLMREGVTTVEIKTGYGLDTENEIKMLRVSKALEESCPIHIEKTFLPLHATPPEFKNNSDEYVEYVCNHMFPAVLDENLATSVDAYCEHIGFSVEQCQKVFEKAKKCGLHIKLHAEQFTDIGGSKLAAEYGALSVDHVEYIKEDSIKAIAHSGSVATLLPGAFYFLQEKTRPPISSFRKYNVPMAIATDMNPGTSPIHSLLLMLNMSVVFFHLTPVEALKGVTINAAKALGLEKQKGSIEVGKDADFCMWDIDHPRELSCQYSPHRLHSVVKGGHCINV